MTRQKLAGIVLSIFGFLNQWWSRNTSSELLTKAESIEGENMGVFCTGGGGTGEDGKYK